MTYKLMQGDCLTCMAKLAPESVDLIYLDPPFFTQRTHSLSPRARDTEYEFADTWTSLEAYTEFLRIRLVQCRSLLSNTGALFFHCDRRASHVARTLLDAIFGEKQFRAEIIWTYRRWSNSQRGLLPSHQTILYYSRSDSYVFNETFVEYSSSTNIDQLLQKRGRDRFNKSVYRRGDDGEIVPTTAKRGVPLGDVWDIPLLNPKATERVGYPTQKPVLLLERIIGLTTNDNDLVLDPFCGSGTTLVAAELMKRRSIGIDISAEAVALAENRLVAPRKTESRLLQAGRAAYANANEEALRCLEGIPVVPVQRNAGIDAILTDPTLPGPVLFRVQRRDETLDGAARKLERAAKGKKAVALFIVAIDVEQQADQIPDCVRVIRSPASAVEEVLQSLRSPSPSQAATKPRRQPTQMTINLKPPIADSPGAS